MSNKLKIVNVTNIIKKCVNCKYYEPNISHTALGICSLNKKNNGYNYNNHFDYAEISRSKHGHCGDEGKNFKQKKLT